MRRYVYGYSLERAANEVFFHFDKVPEIISALPADKFDRMSAEEIKAYATDAVITTLQSNITHRLSIPEGGLPQEDADGVVVLHVQQAMKLELARLMQEKTTSIAQFARAIGKPETAARRLLNLSHRSHVDEIESAAEAFGRRFESAFMTVKPVIGTAATRPFMPT